MTGEKNEITYVETAATLPVPGTFHYEVPAHLAPLMRIGLGLIVPFQKRRVTAFVVAYPADPPPGVKDIRPVEAVLSPDPFFDAAHLEMYQFMSRYYLAPLGEVLRTAMPAGALAGAKKYACATQAGRAAFRTGGLDAKSKDVLRELLSKPDGLSMQALTGRVPAVGEQALKTMERKGFIRIEMRLAMPKKKFVDHFLAADEVLAAEALRKMRRAKKKRAVLGCLLDAGRPLSAEEIKSATGAPPGTFLRDLERDGLILRTPVEVFRVRDFHPDPSPPPRLTAEQAEVCRAVSSAVEDGVFKTFLLHGVTGSGKTEVYLRLVKDALDAGKTALVLAPEIALTPLLLSRFAGRFGSSVYTSHSGIKAAERVNLWRRIAAGQVTVVVGARSALFSPLQNLGLIVVDEEHDASYKQDDGVAYNARDLAVYLAREASCPVVLGSATPSCESYQAAVDGRYALLSLTKRVRNRSLPPVTVVDLRPIVAEERRRKKEKSDDKLPHARVIFSEAMKSALAETVAAGEQAVLLLNRRGYSTHVFCLVCGSPVYCPNCDVTLKFHLGRRKTACHHCDYETDPPEVCAICGAARLFYAGAGTEQVEHELSKLFPEARVVRMDRDTVTKRDGHEVILSAFGRREFDILLGTQMVAKGHDFPNVTLVGVLSADTTLSIPDFRSAERTFQLLTQAAGRAGRDDKPGRIVIQTFNPRHYAIECATRHDFQGFFQIESERRRRSFYPPYSRLALVRVSSLDEITAQKAAAAAARAIAGAMKKAGAPRENLVGPAKSPISLLRGRCRYQMLIKAADPGVLRFIAQSCLSDAKIDPQAEITIDIDPQNML